MYHIHEDKRVEKSVEQICQALNDMILEGRPRAALSVTALSARAGVSKATFYRSFDAIEDVLRYQVDQAVRQMIAYLMEARADEQHPGELALFRAFFRFWMAHSAVVELLIQTKTTYLLMEAFSAALFRHINFFGRYTDEDVIPYFVAVRAASLTAVLECWLGDQKRTHPDDMPQLLMRLMKPGGMPRPRPDGPCRGPSV